MSSVRSETSKPESALGLSGSRLVVQGYQTVLGSMGEDFSKLSVYISFAEILVKCGITSLLRFLGKYVHNSAAHLFLFQKHSGGVWDQRRSKL